MAKPLIGWSLYYLASMAMPVCQASLYKHSLTGEIGQSITLLKLRMHSPKVDTKFPQKMPNMASVVTIFNRTSVAGAFLQTLLSIIA